MDVVCVFVTERIGMVCVMLSVDPRCIYYRSNLNVGVIQTTKNNMYIVVMILQLCSCDEKKRFCR